MKKLILVFLALTLTLSFAACNKEEKKETPKEAPEFDTVIEEYEQWSAEYINSMIVYKNDPTNPVNEAVLNRWPVEIEEWTVTMTEMFVSLYDFTTEREEYFSELNRISKKIIDAVTDEVTSEDVDEFLTGYEAWADDYVSFLNTDKIDYKYEEFKEKYAELIIASVKWTNKASALTSKITDSELLARFASENERIAAKVTAAEG